MAENNITITVKAEDLASQALNKIGGEAKGLGDKSGDASGKVDKLGNKTKEAGNKAKEAKKPFVDLKGVIAGIATIKTLQTIGDLATKAAKFQDISKGFERSFGNAAEGLEKLRTASRGTIADMDLMLAANKAALLGVTSNTDQLAGVMQTAILRGKELGLTTTQAFDDIVTGIGRGSPLILDNLGIKIPEAFKKATEKMSEAEKTQALLNLVIKDGVDLASQYAGQTDSASDKIARMQAKMENLSTKIGEVFIPIFSGFVDVVSGLVDEVLKLGKTIEGVVSNAKAMEGVAKAPSMAEHKRMAILDLATTSKGERLSTQVGQGKQFASDVQAIDFLKAQGRLETKGSDLYLDGKKLNFARGGSFVTNGPRMMMVGDNPGGREHVEVTPMNRMGGKSTSGTINIVNNFTNHVDVNAIANRLAFQLNTAK